MSAGEAEKHRAMLKLAVLSEHSCEAVLKTVGREVSKLFPQLMVLEERVQVLEGYLQ